MLELFRSLKKNRRLVRDFVVRDLKGRYIGSSMGFFWSVIFPIINLAVYWFVFRLVLHSRFSDKQSPTEAVFIMLAGILVWQCFAETISRSTNTLVENSNLIQKVVFPSEVLPAYLALSALINMCIGLPVVLLGVAYFGFVSTGPGANAGAAEIAAYVPTTLDLGWPLVILPLLFALQIMFALGIGYFLATLNLILRDTFHLVGVFTTVWMFSTPIFYPAVMVKNAGFGWLLEINPMTWLIDAYRAVLLHAEWPDWMMVARFAVVATLVLALGASFFQSQKQRFPDLL